MPDDGSAPPRTIVTLPQSAQVLAADSRMLAVVFADRKIHFFDMSTGADSASYPSGGAPLVFSGGSSGTFRPDGSELAYAVSSTTDATSKLVTMSVHDGFVSRVRIGAGEGAFDTPSLWTNGGIVATSGLLGDTGPFDAVVVSPTTGVETASTHINPDGGGPVYSSDGVHAADTSHTDLGDTTFYSGGGASPHNTLRTFVIGAHARSVLEEPHHELHVLAVSPDGSTLLYYDDSGSGGTAGITLSPDFGLFFLHDGVRQQLAHWDGNSWRGAAFFDHSDAVVARHVNGDEQLLMVGANRPTPTLMDTVAGGIDGSPFIVTGLR